MPCRLSDHNAGATGPLEGVVSRGVAGGLVASLVMSEIHSVSRNFLPAVGPKGEDSTVKTASAISEAVFHYELTDEEKKLAGPACALHVWGAYGRPLRCKRRTDRRFTCWVGNDFWHHSLVRRPRDYSASSKAFKSPSPLPNLAWKLSNLVRTCCMARFSKQSDGGCVEP